MIGFLSSGDIGPSEEEESSGQSTLPRIHVVRTNFGASAFSNMLQYHKGINFESVWKRICLKRFILQNMFYNLLNN